MSYNCQFHQEQIISVCTSVICHHPSRLICSECFYNHHCYSKMKLPEFLSELKGVCQDVEFEKLYLVFDQTEFFEHWHSFIRRQLEYIAQKLFQLSEKASDKIFNVKSKVLKSEVIGQLSRLIEEEQWAELDTDAVELGVLFVQNKGQFEDQLLKLQMRRDSVLKELELLESTIQKQIHLFSQHAEELIEALTEPTEFEHFRKLKELQRVDDQFSSTAFFESFPLNMDSFATIGTKGELMLWQLPTLELIQRLKLKPEEKPYFIQKFEFKESEYLLTWQVYISSQLISSADKFNQDCFMIWSFKFPFDFLNCQPLEFHLNKIQIQGEYLYAADFSDSVFVYKFQQLDDDAVGLVQIRHISFWELRKSKIDRRSFFIIDIQVTADQYLLVRMPRQISVFNLQTYKEEDIISDKYDIIQMVDLGHRLVAYVTSISQIKIYSLDHNRSIRDFMTPHKKITCLTMVHPQIIAYIADSISIIIHRITDGSEQIYLQKLLGAFIRVQNGIICNLIDLKYNPILRHLYSVNQKGILSIWGNQPE